MHQKPARSLRPALDYDNRFDRQFESQLPPEVRAELEIPPRSTPRPSARIPETEEEIAQALEWLKSQGYLRPASPAPPLPVSSPQPPAVPMSKTPPPARRAHIPAVIGTVAIAALFLYAVSHTGGPSNSTALPESRSVPNPSSQPVEVRRALTPPVEVRRALPAVPRALLVSRSRFSENAPIPAPYAESQPVRMPDGTIVEARYQGELPSSAALPVRGRFIGEEWSTGNTSWIWLQPAGASLPSWVDP